MPLTALSQTSYAIEELLVSRTDERGVIRAANDVFCSVAGYEREALIGAPHKIVRHPDMSRGVFYLIWDFLNKGLPVAGYVKNRCKSGGYYWVFATVSPYTGGHVSMRMCPEPSQLAVVQGLYDTLREAEAGQTFTPEQSAAFLADHLKTAGYRGYPAFMADQLARTQMNRCAQMGRALNPAIPLLREVSAIWEEIMEACDAVGNDYRAFRGVSTNLQVQAGHLQGSGIALSVVANNFASIATEIHKDLNLFQSGVERVSVMIDDALFLFCIQDLMSETHEVLIAESEESREEGGLIQDQATQYKAKVDDAMGEVFCNLASFAETTKKMKRNLSSLSVTRVMCAIENAQMNAVDQKSISTIINELKRFQMDTAENLRKIGNRLDRIAIALRQVDRRDQRTRHQRVA